LGHHYGAHVLPATGYRYRKEASDFLRLLRCADGSYWAFNDRLLQPTSGDARSASRKPAVSK
jgi:hypothetical protein